MADTESGSAAINAPFDKEATLQMVNGAKATISGQVFARGHSQSKHFTAKMQLVNWDPKQVAPRGTQVFLIPYTDYFKEWDKMNEAQWKKGLEVIPLSEEAAGGIKTTTVDDDAGHFEFVNMMPGDYVLYTEFNFIRTWRKIEVAGNTDYYKNGTYQTTVSNIESRKHSKDVEANIRKVVTVSKPGEESGGKTEEDPIAHTEGLSTFYIRYPLEKNYWFTSRYSTVEKPTFVLSDKLSGLCFLHYVTQYSLPPPHCWLLFQGVPTPRINSTPSC